MAYHDLNDALDEQATRSVALDSPIYVRGNGAAKPYKPDRRTDPSDPRSATFQLNPEFIKRLRGGYLGSETTESPLGSPSQTVLEGDVAPGIEKPVYHVATGVGFSNTLFYVDGFRVINGLADGAVRDHTAGGGMRFTTARAWARDCEFDGNTATRAGGALAVESAGYENGACQDNQLWLGLCTFSGNVAGKGGAIYVRDYHEIRDSPLTGLQLDFAEGTAVHSSRFIGNRALDGGALRFEYALAGMNHSPPSLSLFSNLFDSNQAVYGGAISLHPYNGARIVANTFSGNVASGGGTCLYVTDPSDAVTPHNCEVVATVVPPTFDGNICWGNATLTALFAAPGMTSNYNNTQGGPLTGINNISTDPLFQAGGFQLTPGLSPCIDTGALVTSRPRDFADINGNLIFKELVALDLLRNPRVAGVSTSQLDMGAIEVQ